MTRTHRPRIRSWTLAVLLLGCLPMLFACDKSPTSPRDTPNAGFRADATASDGTVGTATAPEPMTIGPSSVVVVLTDESFHPRGGGARLDHEWVITPGPTVQAVDYTHTFTTAREYVVQKTVRAGGESATASMVITVSAGGSVSASTFDPGDILMPQGREFRDS